ncbi:kinase-like protein [Aspergillus ibericus CBS 121593]|uniref:non-specific serine/threonine protein kinase n=1 Tax=Aspergillus ibericus CBS 121593 TaxID=1448316 RepID=A0A395GW36_9EURO|nr:kinase-like protein [Aspergillus ibericus CBS 121593]RAK99790.1 kinase-like protein [Aspergillus ibericus CBS 121593]
MVPLRSPVSGRPDRYDPKTYYPARIGETICNRYRIISKLCWGTNSTAWLAKDVTRWMWQSNRYVTLKITNRGKEEQKSAHEEVEMSQQISRLRSSHEGRRYVRLVKESFEIQGRLGNHLCLVFEPLREPLWLLGKHLGSNGVPSALSQDLKSDNFLLGFEDSTVLETYVRQQESDPAPFKDGGGRPVFQFRPDFGYLRKGVGLVHISDFSSAVSGRVSVPHNHDIQPQPFCAPEVLLKATWTYSADIWNLGTMLWELLADEVLFNGLDPTGNTYSRAAHIAQMIRLLGPPSKQLLARADEGVCSRYFSSQGDFKFPSLIPPEEFNLSNATPFLHGEDKKLFLDFVRRMFRWEPEERPTAKELYDDSWLDFRP